ncbi:Adenylate cyclase type 10 [Orchesella cincta]|uniref:Adenylate cyclase type 10 n=1 Tax=Orchesella cincta TaxID=48709 RepID=A0A1D2NDT9_ORCCI|nr:Adenylate cyclase type 10 [Orchesella cincta]
MPAATTASAAAGQGNIDNALMPPGNAPKVSSRRSLTQNRGDLRGPMMSNTGAAIGSGENTVRNAELQNYVVNKIELLKRTQFNIKKLNQLCSFIPDFILLDEVNRKIPYQLSHEAVVLMADVSGFTALTEAYSLRGKGGTDQLTKTLAGYIGPLAECILQADGDIIKYAGDAILAFWKTTQDDYPEEYGRNNFK